MTLAERARIGEVRRAGRLVRRVIPETGSRKSSIGDMQALPSDPIRDVRRALRRTYRSLIGGPDVWVLSYPKSGRTWHRALLGTYIAQGHGLDLRGALNVRKMCLELGLPVIDYEHNGANFMYDNLPSDPSVADPGLWQGRKVILLTRDLRDVVTSAYFHARFRTNVYHEELCDFIRDPKRGVEKILVAYNRWHDNRHRAAEWLHLRYEDMHKDPSESLRSSLAFAGIADGGEKAVLAAVEFCRADNLRRLEQEGFFDSGRLRPSAENPELGAKVRRATVGDHANHLSAEDLDFIAALETRLGNPFR